jgi:hypothetical protein
MGKKRLGLYLIGYNLEKDGINPVTFIVFANSEKEAVELASVEYPALYSIETYTCIGPLDCERTGVHGFLNIVHDLHNSNDMLIKLWQTGEEIEEDDPSEVFALQGQSVLIEDDKTCSTAEIPSVKPLDNALVEDVNPPSEIKNIFPNVSLEPHISYVL